MVTTEVAKNSSGAKPRSTPRPLWRRLAWLVGIWTASVLALAAVAWLMRLFMTAAGLGTP